jgi:uncharacterized protein DUF5671
VAVNDLAAFVEHARSRGMDHSTIRMLLLSAGWKEKDVARVLAEHSLEMPVPAPPDVGGAREAFLHLLAFSTLYAGAIALVWLFFEYVNRLLPDPAFRGPAQSALWSLQSIRWWLAVVLVSFPLFLLLSRFVLREMHRNPERSWSGVRRWLTYLTLFVAAIALGADFVTLVYYFLQGELSLRFLLKVSVVCLVAGMVFAYYLKTVRMPPKALAESRMHAGFAVAASILFVGTLVWGFALAGSPRSERLRRLDERRVEDLKAIEEAIDRICLGPTSTRPEGPPEMKKPLPKTLDEIVASAPSDRPSIVDPATGAPYEYRITGQTTLELCATFDRARDESWDVRWNHPAGRHCFEIDLLNPE